MPRPPREDHRGQRQRKPSIRYGRSTSRIASLPCRGTARLLHECHTCIGTLWGASSKPWLHGASALLGRCPEGEWWGGGQEVPGRNIQLFALCGPECVTEPLQLQRSVGEMEIHKENGNEDLRYWSFGAAKCLEASIAENNDVRVVESMARRRYGK